MEEANAGTGLKMPAWLQIYCKWILPVLIISLFILGVYKRFAV